MAELERNELLRIVAEERGNASSMWHLAEKEHAIAEQVKSEYSAKAASMRRLAEKERAIAEQVKREFSAKASSMQRLAEKEHGIAERLKRECSTLAMRAEIANLRLRQVKQDVRVAGAPLLPRSIANLFKTVCSTDLLFLMDTTGSMRDYIQAVKEQVMNIVNDVKVAFLNDAQVRIAVVGYRDHSDTPNIEFLDFTLSVDRVKSFLKGLIATGGADEPEDVLGGIQKALSATWKQQTRCIIHIADAPPHGRTLHDFYDHCDRYCVPGSEPHGLTHKLLLQKLIGFDINYALLRINEYTDRMAFEFFQAYNAASADCKLHARNRYYREACTIHKKFRSGNSKHRPKAGLHFEEAMLGTQFSALRHLVLTVVTSSASCTAARVLMRAEQVREKELDTNKARILEEIEDEVNSRLKKIRTATRTG